MSSKNVVGGSGGETFRSGPPVEREPHDFTECYPLTMLPASMSSNAVQPIMKARGKGAIVNTASGAGVNPGTGQGAYDAYTREQGQPVAEPLVQLQRPRRALFEVSGLATVRVATSSRDSKARRVQSCVGSNATRRSDLSLGG